MSENKNSGSNTLNWIIALASTGAMLLLLAVLPTAFWLLLPLSVTYLAKAFKVI